MAKLVYRNFNSKVKFLLALFLISFSAHANVGETYGFGSRTLALSGATVADGAEGYAAYTNPAQMPLGNSKRLLISYGLFGMAPSFKPIDNVVTTNTFTSDKLSTGSFDTNYKSTLGQTFGIVYRLLPEWNNLSLGFTAYFPLQQVVFIDSGEVFGPEYFMYRSRTQRPQFDLSAGLSLSSHFYAGAGIQLAYNLAGNGTLFVQTSSSQASSMRFSASTKPKVSPLLSFLYASEEHPSWTTSEEPPPHGSFQIGGVARFPSKSENSFTVNASARAIGGLAVVDFNYRVLSALYYDPWSFELGGAYQYSPKTRLFLQLDYQLWSKFEVPALTITDVGSSGILVAPSQNPTYAFKDILIPRIAHEWWVAGSIFRLGYAYRPSILKNLSTGSGNYLDPPKHMMSAGWGFHFKTFLGFITPCNLDLNFSWHQLATQNIAKVNSTDIGAPGYEAGGRILGGGASLTLPF